MHKRHLLLLSLPAACLLLWFALGRKGPTPEPAPSATEVRPATVAASPQPPLAPPAKVEPEQSAPLADSRWPAATVLQRQTFATATPGVSRRVTLLEVAGLPYPVRVEEQLRRDRGGEEALLQREEMVADRVIVRLADGVTPEQFDAAFAARGIRILKRISSIGLYKVSVPATLDGVPEARSALASRPDLARYAEPDFIVHALTVPNDPRYSDGSLWGLHNTGQNDGTDDIDIDAPEGWDIRTDASEIIVGVIDTGVRYTHEDLAANMWINPGESGMDEFGNDRAANGIDDDGNGAIDDVHGINAISEDPVRRGDPMDDHGHGSHTAGTIGAFGNNGLGVAGVAWQVQLMALKFLGANGGTSGDAIECMEYALQKGARVLNNSWGGGGFNQAMIDMIRLLRDNGVVFVAAAGNDASSNDAERVYPASYAVENVVPVAALDRKGALAGYSNFGYGTVHVAAPGSSVLSAGIASDSDYATMSGTSMACPHVAGIMALLAAEYPDEDYAAHINRLLASVTPLPSLDGMVLTGGIVNLAGALATPDARPFNDDFARAAPMRGSELIARASLRHATTEPGEPQHAGLPGSGSTWWRWTAPVPGQCIVSLTGSDFDTRLAVYTGESLAELTEVASNDDYADSPQSRVQFVAVEGVTYHIAVSGTPGAVSLVQLALSGPPENDLLARAIDLGAPGAARSANSLNATAEPGEPAHAGQPAKRSLWWKWTPGFSGKTIFSTGQTAFDSVIAVYTGPAENPEMADLRLVAENDDNPFAETWAQVKLETVAGTTYYIAVDHKAGEESVAWLGFLQAEINDDFADRLPLAGDAFNVTGWNIRATFEEGEPDHHGQGSGYSVWWEWTPQTSGTYLITTAGSYLYTVLGVYTGTRVDKLDTVASDRSSGLDFSSQVVVDATAGQPYPIAVDLAAGASYFGIIRLEIAPIALALNDAFADATVIETFPAVVAGHNNAATIEPDEPAGIDFGGFNSVWWKWTPTATAEVAVSTAGSNFDTVLGVYTGSSLDTLVQVAIDDESGGNRTSFVHFTAVAGLTYYFRVTGYGGDSGDIVLNLGAFQRPANDNLAQAEEITGNFFQREVSNAGASEEPGEPDHAPVVEGLDIDHGGSSLWWKWTPTKDTDGRTVASTYGKSIGSTVAVYEGPATNPTYPQLRLVSANTHRGRPNWNYSTWGQVVWNAVAGRTYYIVLDGDYGSTGQLAFSFWMGPPHDWFSLRMNLTGLVVDTEGVVNFGAGKEGGEPSHAGNSGGKSLWWQWTPPASGLYKVSTEGSLFEGYWGISDLDTLLAIYTGTTLSNLVKVASNNDMAPTRGVSELVFEATAGTPYKIAVDGNNDDDDRDPAYAAAGWVELHIAPFAGPANDDFADAAEVSGVSVLAAGSLLGATRESGEPAHAGKSNRSLWWKWTAPESGDYFAANPGMNYLYQPTRYPGIAVYTGDAVDELTLIASAASGAFKTSGLARTRFAATAGTTYYFAIDDSDESSRHEVRLMIEKAPANDDFANAPEIIGRSAVVTGHNLGANEETGEPQIESWKEPAAQNTSVWWKWTAGASGLATIDTLGSQIFSILGVYAGDAVGQLSQVATADSIARAPEYHSAVEDRMRAGCGRLDFNAVAGTTYYIMVCGSYYDRSSQGRITLAIDGPPGTPLTTPAKFSVAAPGTGLVELSWQDRSNGEAGFAIERATGDGPFVLIGTAPANAGSFTDTNVDPGTVYHYRIRAIGYEPSPWTQVLTVQTRFITHATYAAWAEANFTPQQLADPAVSDPAADPDGDLLPNRLERLLILNPLIDDTGKPGYPAMELVHINGVAYLSLRFSWLLDAADATLSLQGSSDFAAWNAIPLDDPALRLFILDEPAVNPQRRTLTIRDNLPLGAGRVLRLLAE